MNMLHVPTGTRHQLFPGLHASTPKGVRSGLPHSSWGKRQLCTLLLVLLLAIGGAWLIALRLVPSTPVPPIPPTPGGGTILAIHSTAGGWLGIGVPGGTVVSVPMAGRRLRTPDGALLTLQDLRPGDSVTTRSGNTVIDSSQSRTTIQGVVAAGLDPDGDTIILHGPTGGVLVEIDSRTRITRVHPAASSSPSIFDGEVVRVHGVLNSRLGEFTQAWSVDVLSTPRAG